ncbi:recombinase family protein [Brevibacillus borstelensis]|uniref:recombinase family protein n=1 Tax=Brevibacillus borstelensis TaxID=45462 RepID=UPI001D0ABF4B|nr:recombinase family protein [Brevibacillus borstelensis]MCC0563799.1 recombinase family protein [Brevibacillus borstelensis]
MNKRKTAVGYIRVSTGVQAREGFSLDNQVVEIKNKCKKEEWELLRIFDDKGISGALLNERPGLIEMMKFIKENNVDYLVIYKFSRLSRNIENLFLITKQLEDTSTHLVSTSDNINTEGPMGKAFMILTGLFAEMERDNIIEQVKGGMSQKAKEGEWNGGTAPLGYDLVEKKLIINEEEARTVKFIYTEYLKGNGYKTIAAKLNDNGVKTKTGGTFSGNSVKDILRNPTYCGKIRWGYRKDWGKRYSDGRRKRVYNEDLIIVEGKHDPIIDEETFNQVQEIIENNPRHHMKRFNGNHLLSGLLRCPDCGSGMSIQPVKKGKTIYEYYTCNQYMNHKTCKPNTINKAKIEPEFLDILEKKVNEPDFRKSMLESLNSSDKQVKELEKIIRIKEKEISESEGKIDKLIDELLNESAERVKATLRKKMEELSQKIEELQTDIGKKRESIKNLESQNLNHDEIVEVFQYVGKVIKSIEDKEKQQSLVRKLVAEIKVEDKHIKEVHFRFSKKFRIGGGAGNRITNSGKAESGSNSG